MQTQKMIIQALKKKSSNENLPTEIQYQIIDDKLMATAYWLNSKMDGHSKASVEVCHIDLVTGQIMSKNLVDRYSGSNFNMNIVINNISGDESIKFQEMSANEKLEYIKSKLESL